MLQSLAADVEREVGLASAGQLQVALRDQVTPTCQQTVSRYPFVRGGNDLPLADFGRVFGTGGTMDTFFKQYLEPNVDKSKAQWTWRQNSELARTLSPDTLRIFQHAADIRDAFFQTGGNIPFVQLTVKPLPPLIPGAKLEIGGATVASPVAPPPGPPGPPQVQPTSISPVQVQWPGGSLRAAVSVAANPNAPPSVLERNGPWSLFRLLEVGSLSVRAEKATAGFLVGGSESRYEFTSGSSKNPLNLAALREFKCPSGI
jgi:type VI secretion system protein ImpL